MNKVLTTLLIVTSALTLTGCTLRKDTWMGFYYKGGNYFDTKYSPVFSTKEGCIEWAEELRNSNPKDKAVSPGHLYECGKNCKLDDDYQYLLNNSPESITENNLQPMYICKVTFDDADWRRGNFGN